MTAIYKEPFSSKTRGDEFGNLAPYRNGRPHRGQDWSPKEFSPIPAITDGTVFLNEWSDVLGWFIVHSAKDGMWVQYAHLAEQSPLKVGTKVKLGDVLGKVGGGKNSKSGTASTGAHLHMSIGKANKAWSNPKIHLASYEDLVDPLKHILANKKAK
jgi:murein DD-endopeptidase MepM/ murein hydrolase activator NlpD